MPVTRNFIINASVLIAFCTLCSAPVALADDSQNYDVSVTSISVWTKVVDDKGKAVEGLTAEDFDVYEDGHKMQINCFDEVKQQEAIAPSGTPKPQDFQQKFVIYMDLLNTTPNELSTIRPRLKDFLARIAVRRPEVMLAALLPTQKLGIVSPFTSDLKRIASLLDRAPGNKTRDSSEVARQDQMDRVIEGAEEKIDALRDAYQLANTFAEQDRQRSEFTLSALESFAAHLNDQNLGDHVVVLYISGGFSSDPGRQYFDQVDSLTSTDSGNMEEMQAVTFHRRPNFDFRKELQKSIGRLNRMNVTISTLDTQGMESSNEYSDSLAQMAEETGGLSFANSRNFNVGLDRILDDLKHQYILCFSPPLHKKTGEYHSIKVVCRHPGVKLRYREGYAD